MIVRARDEALTLLRRALADPAAEFRDGQWEAIASLSQHHTRSLVVQRTGWGKSLVYFVTTRLLRNAGHGPTLLISPLLALMRNQVLAAERLGLKAATINSSNRTEWAAVRDRVLADEVDVLLISPERLANEGFHEDILQPIVHNVGLFVVDEAHCISDWGHDFRPDYGRIVRVLQALPRNVPVLATTATANNRVVEDVRNQLGSDVLVVRGPLARTSVLLQNISLPSQAARMAWLADHLPRLPGSGIIYTLTIGDAQRVAGWLQAQRIDAHSYWGGQDSELRVDLEERLLRNEIKALVATTALGMGFDKPDLSFVIHYQRPGSVVHYYQQVGRAGRAVPRAYGILLGGHEDDEITEYFIRTAFPPEAHCEEVLQALYRAEDGLSRVDLEQRVNLSSIQIEKVLKSLAVKSPTPISKLGSRWYANPVSYVPDRDKIAALTRIRYQEQARMQEYMCSSECLMLFLERELDDPSPAPCGRCAVCRGEPLLPEEYSWDLALKAVQFLRRCDHQIDPRKRWPADALDVYGWRGSIAGALQAAPGRALCSWGDDGWGELVRRGKQETGRFDDALVDAAVALLRERWRPDPFPTWVTCVPSLDHPELVPDVSTRVAKALGRPFVPSVRKVRRTEPQKAMQNSYQQAHNLARAFTVRPWSGFGGPVLLLDDMVDSRWTFTVIAALLRSAGSGPVFPLALSSSAGSE